MVGTFNPEDYDSWYEHHPDIYNAELEAINNPLIRYSRPWLEIGVGTGRFAASLGIELGIDPDPKMLEFAKKRGVNVMQAYGEHLPIQNSSYGAVLLITVLPFLSDPREVFKEAKRILKSNGGLILSFIPENSYFGRKYRTLKENGDERFKNAYFYSFTEVLEMLDGIFNVKNTVSTLLGEEISLEIKDGYITNASFVVLECTPI